MSEALTGLFAALADRYRIVREIGSGGMATVYLAHDIKHERDVAVKVLRPELAAVLGAERFLNEIKISARLDHPHILTLIDSGASDGFLFYVLPFVRGESLRDRLNREKQLGVDEALDITRQITSALDYAHRQGIVHRDIKPENILIHEGEAMLTDFGIAMAVKQAGGNRLTETGLSLGTPQYMSPEQATGDRTLDARSDVYSMGAVLYEMLTGEPPHTGATVQAIIAKLMTERPTRVRVLRDTVSEGVDNAVAKALAKVPADRYANAGDFARALATSPTPLQQQRKTNWIPFVAGGAILAMAALAAFVALRRKPDVTRVEMDRVQVTNTGNASTPSMSPDASRIAFSEKQCDADGYCTYRLVIQDAAGSGRLVLTENISTVWKTFWTEDARFLVYGGSYGSAKWGAFAISTLGGSPRFLGCCSAGLLGGDTIFITPAGTPDDSVAWVRLVAAHDGQILDSIRVRDPGLDYAVFATDDKDRLLMAVTTRNQRLEIRLTDGKGSRELDRIDIGPARGASGAWLRGHGSLLLAIYGPTSDVNLLRYRVSMSRIDRKADTLASHFQLTGFYDVSSDAKRFAFALGPIQSAIWKIDLAQRSTKGFSGTPLLSSTTPMFGRISPLGDKILVGRVVPGSGERSAQLLVVPYAGGAETPLIPSANEVLDYEWAHDGSKIFYLEGVGPDTTRLMVVDTTGRIRSEIGSFNRASLIGFQVLRNGGFAFIRSDRRTLDLVRRPGSKDETIHSPSWINYVSSLSSSPDGRAIAVAAWDRNSDSVVIARIDLNTKTFSRLATYGGETLGRVTWLKDGKILFVFRETRGAFALYKVSPGTPPVRVGALPQNCTSFSISADGTHMSCNMATDQTDVYVIRNFAELLR
jgi:serine/threonine protein kinase